LLEALEPALARHKLFVETCSADDAVDAVVVAAPDLVVLAGDAAKEGGLGVLAQLANSPHTSVVPVALLSDDSALEARLRAFRHGAAAVIPKSASVDAIAERIARLAREIPDRGGSDLGDIGESTLEELVRALTKQLKTGILSVHTGAGDDTETLRLVLGAGKPLTEAIEDFVDRVRGQVVMAEALRWEFDEHAGGTIQLLGGDDAVHRAGEEDIAGMRILLADDDAARADAVARELRDRGVTLVVSDLEPSDVRLARLRQLDPGILLVGEEHARGKGYQLMRRLRNDSRLKWSALLVVRWNEVWTEDSPIAGVDRILGTLAQLAEPEQSARQRASAGVAFDTRLEIMGPARILRAIAASTRTVRMTVTNPRAHIQVDVSEQLIVGSMCHLLDGSARVLEGPTSLAALLVLSSGRVRVEPVEQPATANIMSTVDVALNAADAEPPPIPPSIPPQGRKSAQRESIADPEAGAQAIGRDIDRAAKDLERGRGPFGLRSWQLALIAGAQGLIVTVAVIWFVKSRPEAPVAAGKSATVSALAPAGSELASAPLAPASATPAASASASVAAPAKPSLSESDAEPLEAAPTCAKLLATTEPPPGVYPGAAFAQLRAARKALVRGDLEETQRAYCRAIRFDASNLQAHVELARVLLMRRDGRSAAEAARSALKLAPEDRGALLSFADALSMTGKFDDARDPLMRGSGLSLNDESGRASLAKTVLALADKAQRRQDYYAQERFARRAHVLAPDEARGAAGVATALIKLDKGESAAIWARRAVKAAPGNIRHRVLLGDALLKAGQRTAAVTAWKEAESLDPDDPELRARLIGMR
jgi:DNA-binding response OmpR family regulator/tetratricopeptide (TPR) repeat protein